jgi:hypothetical protein
VSDAPVRRFVFLAGDRLDELYGQTGSWAKSKGRELRGFSFTVLGTGGGVQRAAPDVRMQLYEEIEHIREYLEESKRLAMLENPKEVAGRDYFYGRLSMFRVPFNEVDPPTLYMVGETEQTFVALGGQLTDMVNRGADYGRAAAGAPLIKDEPEFVVLFASVVLRDGDREEPGQPAPLLRWQQAVIDTHQRFVYYPEQFRKKNYEILAYKDEFSRADELADLRPAPKNVLLGKPLFVAEG